METAWIEASEKLASKIGSPADAWSGDHLGMYHSLSTIDRSPGASDGTRSYSVTGYLMPNADRTNLHVLCEALVTTLQVQDDGSVTGVNFVHGEKAHFVKVKKEVVLSAGPVSNYLAEPSPSIEKQD